MASALVAQEFFSRIRRDVFALTGVGPAVAAGGYLDMSQYGNFAITVIDSVLSGSGLAQIEIVAAVDAAGTNAQQITTKTLTPSAPVITDFATLEIIADQIREVATASGFNLRFVAARVTLNAAGDKVIVVCDRWRAKFPQQNLTADVIH